MEASNPVLSRALGFLSLSVLSFSLLTGVSQIIEQITQFPPIAENVGTFSSRFSLPAVANIGLVLATLTVSTEHALRLRCNRILDGGFFGGDDQDRTGTPKGPSLEDDPRSSGAEFMPNTS